jgi:hypothetical protein
MASNVYRSVAVAVAGVTPSAMGPLLPLVLPEMPRTHGFKNVE